MNEKNPSGFEPVKFHRSGKLLLFPAAGLVIVGLAAQAYPIVIAGLALGLISLYLIFIVQEKQK